MKKSLAAAFGKLAALCYEISNETNHDVFLNYNPHINSLDIHIYEGGWKRDEEKEPVWLAGIGGKEITFSSINELRRKLRPYKKDACVATGGKNVLQI